MKLLVQLVKEGRVIDAYTVEATSEDDLAEACSKAIAHSESATAPQACWEARPKCASSLSESDVSRVERTSARLPRETGMHFKPGRSARNFLRAVRTSACCAKRRDGYLVGS